MKTLRWSLALLGACFAFAAGSAEAQSVVVQGQVQVQQPPAAYGQPPPGYGYGQPVYQQPYAPVYAQPPQQRQLQYVERDSSIKGLWIPGIIVFGVSWLLTGTLAETLSYNYDYALYNWIPLVGPWIALTEAENDAEVGGAVVGGVVQLAGLAMFALGLLLRQTERVAVYSLDERDERAPTLSFAIAPAIGGGTVGVTLSHF